VNQSSVRGWAEAIAPCQICSIECCLGSHLPQRAFELTFFIANPPLQLISPPAPSVVGCTSPLTARVADWKGEHKFLLADVLWYNIRRAGLRVQN
jgi:hypothetical protein